VEDFAHKSQMKSCVDTLCIVVVRVEDVGQDLRDLNEGSDITSMIINTRAGGPIMGSSTRVYVRYQDADRTLLSKY
jgi:hypothetical protein